MPVTREITETKTRTVTLMTMQEYADASLADEYRQPLKTIEEALAVHGWDVDPIPDNYRPTCCGGEVKTQSFLGGAYLAICEKCGRFVFDVTAPTFGNSWVTFPSSDKIDMETDYERRWIAATQAARP